MEPARSPKRALTSATAAARSHSGEPVWPGRQGSSTGAGSSMVSSGVTAALAGATRSWAAEVSGLAPASRL